MPFLPKGAEWIIILIVILLIFGPKNLPKLGSALGKTVSNLRAGMNEGKKKETSDATADKGEAADGADSKLAEIEGEVESVETVEDIEEVEASDEPAMTSDAHETAPSPDEAEKSPKKVRRVVKKRVNPQD